MPIVNVDARWLSTLLGRSYEGQQLSDALDDIGCDVEGVLNIPRHRCPSCSNLVEGSLDEEEKPREVKTCRVCGANSEVLFAIVDTVEVIRIDLGAARPDLVDIGGMARALRGSLGLALGLPDYAVSSGSLTVHVDPQLYENDIYRPFIRCAVVTMPPLDETSLITIMKLQENLHWIIGRDRKLASIGVYDLDTLRGDIHYRTIAPDQEQFTPLGLLGTLERPVLSQMTGREILDSHPKGMAYAHLLAGHRRYPILIDDAGQVLSMPPIINSEETKLKPGSTRLFVDVTGPTEPPVIKSLDTLVSSLIEIGGRVETVTINAPGGVVVSPDLTPREVEVNLPSARSRLGIPLTDETLVESLRKMRLDAEPVPEKPDQFKVRYPAYRTDIRHMVDVFEDMAIGYGYSNIEPKLVPTMTVGQARPEEIVSDIVRKTLLGLGYSEIMSLPLDTEDDHFKRLRMAVPEHYPRIENPKLVALKVVRTHLVSGLLEALYVNQMRPMPLRLFEIDNVVVLDSTAETGVREERRVAFVEMGPDAGYAGVRSAMDSMLMELGFTGEYAASDEPMFISGRSASITTAKEISGRLGELHPQVITGHPEDKDAEKPLRNVDAPPILDHPVALGELVLCRVL